MQRTGPTTPRTKRPNPIPQGSGIIDRLKRAKSNDERILLRDEARGYEFISKRTKRRIASI